MTSLTRSQRQLPEAEQADSTPEGLVRASCLRAAEAQDSDVHSFVWICRDFESFECVVAVDARTRPSLTIPQVVPVALARHRGARSRQLHRDPVRADPGAVRPMAKTDSRLARTSQARSTSTTSTTSQYRSASCVRFSTLPFIPHSVGSERDAITGLRAPTHYGRPNWDRIFQSVAGKHTNADVGVFFCGVRSMA
jgi:hypothetical protein